MELASLALLKMRLYDDFQPLYQLYSCTCRFPPVAPKRFIRWCPFLVLTHVLGQKRIRPCQAWCRIELERRDFLFCYCCCRWSIKEGSVQSQSSVYEALDSAYVSFAACDSWWEPSNIESSEWRRHKSGLLFWLFYYLLWITILRWLKMVLCIAINNRSYLEHAVIFGKLYIVVEKLA